MDLNLEIIASPKRFFVRHMTSETHTSIQRLHHTIQKKYLNRCLQTFYEFNTKVQQMIQNLDQQARRVIPMYSKASDLTIQSYQASLKAAENFAACATNRIEGSKSEALKVKESLEKGVDAYCFTVANTLLCRAESIILAESEKPETTKERRRLRARVIKMYNKLLGDLLRGYFEQAHQYSGEIVAYGRNYMQQNFLPMYIKIKATSLVFQEILSKMIEDQLVDMKMTYSVSKDRVTMLIKGNFDGEAIARQVVSRMENFKELTVEVVHKGLEIKVDKQSLYENYETFSLKLLEIIKEVREKGTETIVEVRQSAADLYKQVLNRIREKEITLRMQYKELEEQSEKKEELDTRLTGAQENQA